MLFIVDYVCLHQPQLAFLTFVSSELNSTLHFFVLVRAQTIHLNSSTGLDFLDDDDFDEEVKRQLIHERHLRWAWLLL